VEVKVTVASKVYEIRGVCYKAHNVFNPDTKKDEPCSVDLCLEWPDSKPLYMEPVVCPTDGNCFFIDSCVEVMVGGKLTKKCASEEGEEAKEAKEDAPADAEQRAPGPRPIAVRFQAGRRCYAGDWALRQSTEKEELTKYCEGLGEPACNDAATCEWRTDAPIWFHKKLQQQSDDATPYLSAHDSPPFGMLRER